MRLFFLSILFPLVAFGDFVGSPSLPTIIQRGVFLSDLSIVNFRMGVDGASAQNEKIRFSRKERALGFSSLKVHGPSIMGLFLMNFKERIEFYLQPGTMEFCAKFQKNNDSFSRKSRLGFAGKAGSRAILLEFKDTSLGVDVHYRFFKGYGEEGKNFLYHDREWKMREWQIGVGISQKIRVFTPYVGVAIRQSKQKIPSFFSEIPRLRARQRHKKGIYCGLVVSSGHSFSLCAEAHFYNESSLTGSLQIRL